MSPEPAKPASKPKPQFGKPEKPDRRGQFIKLGFLILCIIAIVWMVAVNPRQKNLVCSSGSLSSLTSFGSCTEE
jgi:hypothetical protein